MIDIYNIPHDFLMALTFWIELFIVILLLASFMVLIGLYVDRRETNFLLARLSKELKKEKPNRVPMDLLCKIARKTTRQDTSHEEPIDITLKNR